MVKVLEPGDKAKVVRCPACQCLFEFGEEDMRQCEGDVLSSWVAVYCPTCGFELGGCDWRGICANHYDPIKEYCIQHDTKRR